MTIMTAKVQEEEAKGRDVSQVWAAVEEQREQMTAEAAGLTDSELQSHYRQSLHGAASGKPM